MGMFDNLYCDYPLPGNNQKYQQRIFQTKSLQEHPTMNTFRITKKGDLVELHYNRTSRILVAGGGIPFPFTGRCYFYCIPSEIDPNRGFEWLEFVAQFKEGHLTSIDQWDANSVIPEEDK